MLIVLPASVLATRSSTESRLCVFTSNRIGPLGDAPTLGMNAKLPLMAILLSWFGYAPVVNVKLAGLFGSPGGIRAMASPVALKPVSAIGLMVAVPMMPSVVVEMMVT